MKLFKSRDEMKAREEAEPLGGHKMYGSKLRDFILGVQDGLVNVLGLLLGVATATMSTKTVLIAGLAATFAESLAMGAVAYTSTKAYRDFYHSELERERMHIEQIPDHEREEIHEMFAQKGFKGEELESIVQKITSNKEVWLQIMMAEELKLVPQDRDGPSRSALIVGFSSLLGSIIPLVPYFFVAVETAVWLSFGVSGISLFAIGAYKAKLTIGSPWKSGIEMFLIGSAAAVAGYLIGLVLGTSLQ
ncbi:MAG TPA: VIT1/CCC1 transporter family protein [Nitrososphaerales archaeon]